VSAEPDNPDCTHLSDHELMARVGRRDRAALAELVRRHQNQVVGLATRFLGRADLAEDVCQDAFLRIFERAGSYRPEAKFTTYLYRIVANLCWDYRRRAARRTRVGQPPEAGTFEADAVVAAQRRERREAVRQAVAQLPDRQRLALILHRFQGMGHKEIAQVTGWTTSAVESCLVRAYGRLREWLADLKNE